MLSANSIQIFQAATALRNALTLRGSSAPADEGGAYLWYGNSTLWSGYCEELPALAPALSTQFRYACEASWIGQTNTIVQLSGTEPP